MIAQAIAAYLSEHHIQQSALCEKAGLEQTLVEDALAGRENLSIDDYLKICAALEVPYEHFFDYGKQTQTSK